MNTLSDINKFLEQNGKILAWIVAGLLAALIIFLVVINAKKKSKKANETKSVDKNEYITALGGEENIISHSINGSRITVELKDYEIANLDSLKEMNGCSLIKMSNKLIIVVENNADQLYKKIFSD